MARMPKFPKGLKARLNRELRKAEQKKKVEARRREIEAMRKKVEAIRKKNRGY